MHCIALHCTDCNALHFWWIHCGVDVETLQNEMWGLSTTRHSAVHCLALDCIERTALHFSIGLSGEGGRKIVE